MTQSAYSGPRKGRSASPSCGILALRAVFGFLLPFLIINGVLFVLATAQPAYHVEIGSLNEQNRVPVTFTIDSRMPVRSVSILMDDQPLDMQQLDSKTFYGEVDHNGAIEFTMENFNGNVMSSVEYVDSLDDQPPVIEESSMENNILVITVSDSQSGVNFDSIYALTADGSTVQPLYIDRENAHVSFQMREDGLTIHISDMLGNESQTGINMN